MDGKIYHLTDEQINMLLKLSMINGKTGLTPEKNRQDCDGWIQAYDSATRLKEELS